MDNSRVNLEKEIHLQSKLFASKQTGIDLKQLALNISKKKYDLIVNSAVLFCISVLILSFKKVISSTWNLS